MDFKIYQHRLTALSGRFNLMVTLVIGLLVTNILMGSLAYYAHFHQRIEVTPFFGQPRYANSENSVDSQYLALMSENFIYLRLNTTPETVKFNHKRLLSFVGSAQYKVFNEQLEKESKLIVQEAISSHFDIESIHPNAHKLSCEISGVLKRTVGGRELKDERLTYNLQFRYNQGTLQITQFTKSEVRYDA